MQTFMPHMFFPDVARCLDNRRLNKQKVECKQIFLALTDPNYGWQNHPAVLMWKGYEFALLDYALYVVGECKQRGMNDTLKPFFETALREYNFKRYGLPEWIYDKRLTSSHRANLLRKDPVFYGKNGWTEQPAKDYFWPTHHKEYRQCLEEPRIVKRKIDLWRDLADPENNTNTGVDELNTVVWFNGVRPIGERI